MTVPRSFVGYERATADALRSGIDNVVQTAAVLLAGAAANDMVVMDTTLTTSGALFNIVFTCVSLIAAYTSRSEVMHVFGKAMPKWLARVLTMALSVFVVLTPTLLLVVSELSARGSNVDGTKSTFAWTSAFALGYGKYRVVELVSMASAAVYDGTAYGLMWLNLALAAVGAGAIVVAMAWQAARGRAKKQVQEVIEPTRASRSFFHGGFEASRRAADIGSFAASSRAAYGP
ncbi:hypothetical protein JKP88DRAFT_285911 [Tribonema minus]|uniref:Uncharacterized protein n=1 Tax=Tribonema minus TaxID=303371 RepID=A0A836CP76_9STRA|nr:hypothetical protein JKP88DRAFT_285911 [Tribonema minus]